MFNKYFPLSRLNRKPVESVQGKIDRLEIKRGFPNCGIVSMAYLMNRSVKEIAGIYKNRYLKAGNWRGRTYDHYRLEMFNDLLGKGDVKVIKCKSKTLGSFLKHEADKTKRYEITTTGHAMAYDKGVLIDQQGIQTQWGLRSRTRLSRVIEITG